MNWGKVDAPLASALARAAAGEELTVFVDLDRSQAEGDVLRRLGLGPGGEGEGDGVGSLASASLLPAQVADLTDHPWVRRVTLSGRLRLLDEP